MADHIDAFDWAQTELGARDTWPAEMKGAVRSLLDTLVPMVALWGERGRLIYNDAYAAFAGARHPEVLGMPVLDAWPEVADFNAHVLREGLQGRPLSFRDQRLVLRRYGLDEDVWLNLDYGPIFDAAGRVLGVLAIVVDTTERIASERRLDILRGLSHGIAARDLPGVLHATIDALAANPIDIPFACALLADAHGTLAPVAAYGAQWRETPPAASLSAEDKRLRDEALSQVREAYAGGQPRACDVRALFGGLPEKASGRAFLLPLKALDLTVGLLVTGKSRVFKPDANYEGFFDLIAQQTSSSLAAVKALQDERARAETLEAEVEQALAERAQAQAQLQQSQRMESLGKLTGGVAHDFNNLLQVISGNLQLLITDVAGIERAEKRVQNGLAAVARGAQLASQLLAFGRRQPLAPKVTNLGRFVRSIDEMLRRTLGERIEVETVVAGSLWNTSVDLGQFENALLNLAINARDAMDGHGKLTIEVGNASLDDEYVRFNEDVTPGQYVMLAVTDTGCGMDRELAGRVFEPFFTTKPEGQGTGLGLSMVYGFAKQSGGHVKLYSEPGQGTTVRLYLPRSHEAEEPSSVQPAPRALRGVETILVAEDDEAVRETVVAMLGELGYQVLKAHDAASALTIIDSGVEVDLLFTDVVMPGPLRSPELARLAQQRLPNLAVLFTSGYTENAIVHGGRLDPGVDLLSKPYTREVLSRKVRQVLDQRKQRFAPRSPASAASSPASAAAATSGSGDLPDAWPVDPTNVRKGDTITVLFVEDDELIRLNMAELIRLDGHDVIEAATATEALAELKQHAVDVLLTDVELPDLSGLELARRACAAVPALGVVFATGHAEAGHENDPALAHAYLLRKPYGQLALNEVLHKAAGRPRA